MKFQYTALSKDSKKLSGTLEADNMAAAKQNLHKMGLSIVSIAEFTGKEPPIEKREIKEAEMQGFKFEAKDIQGKEVNGTIDAPDAFSAYRRLNDEFKFEVSALFATGLSEEEEGQKRREGVSDLEEQLKKVREEESDQGILSFMTKKPDAEEQLEALDEQSQSIQQDVEDLVRAAKEIVDEYGSKMPAAQLDEIHKTMNSLLRIKMSNNFQHIQQISEKLSELINPKEHTDPIYGVYNVIKDRELAEKREVSDTVYKEVARLKGIRSSIRGVTDSIKLLLQKQKKGEARVAKSTILKQLWLIISVRDNELREMMLQQLENKTQLQLLKKDLKVLRDEKKKEVIAKNIEILERDIDQLQEAIEEYKQSHQSRSVRRLISLRRVFAWLLALYTLTFFVLQFGGRVGISSLQDISTTVFSMAQNIILILVCVIAFLMLTLKIRYAPQSFAGTVVLSILGLFMVFVLVSNV